ncbi:MAG: hypothetical protein QXQ18_01895 [Candidatus Aenigmatarchaeota archaeon]
MEKPKLRGSTRVGTNEVGYYHQLAFSILNYDEQYRGEVEEFIDIGTMRYETFYNWVMEKLGMRCDEYLPISIRLDHYKGKFTLFGYCNIQGKPYFSIFRFKGHKITGEFYEYLEERYNEIKELDEAFGRARAGLMNGNREEELRYFKIVLKRVENILRLVDEQGPINMKEK